MSNDELQAQSGANSVLKRWLPSLAETAVGGLAVVAGIAWPPAAFAALGAPVVGAAVARQLQVRVSDGEAVLAQEGVTQTDVATAMERNAAVADLLRTSVDGVLTTRDSAQRRLLARALARGVKDDAEVEPEIRVARTVAQLDVPDLQALRVLCARRPERPHPNEDGNVRRYPDTLWPDELREEWQQSALVAEEVMAKLVGLGLAYDRGGITYGGLLHWNATDFGRAVMARLEEEAQQLEKEA